MPQVAALEKPTIAVRLCRECAWSRTREGLLFTNEDRAFCGEPGVQSDSGEPVPCELHRFSKASQVLHVCGAEAIFWEPRA